MNLDELRKLPPEDLDALALARICGWRWLRRKNSGLCSLQPPEPATWNVPGQWETYPWGPDAYEPDPVEGTPPDDERYSDWWGGGRCPSAKGSQHDRYGMPRPSQKIEDAYELEEAIAKAGRPSHYADVLQAMVCDNDGETPENWWKVAHASPMDRTLAAVLTMEVSR